MHVWERGRTVKILITTLGNKKNKCTFSLKQSKETEP